MGQDCKFCGAYISGRADKCPACGKRINYKEESKTSYSSGYSSGASQAYSYAEPEKETKKEEPKTESYTYSYKEDPRTHYETAAQPSAPASADADAKENQLISFLCYFGLLFLVPYLLRPNSEFVKFHSNQGLILFIAGMIANVAANVVPFFGWLVGVAAAIFTFACFLKGLINVYHLEKKELPFIGSFRLLK